MCIKLPKVIKCINWRAGEEIGLKSLWEFFCGGWGDGVGLWLILLNMGYYTLYKKSCILETES